MGKEMDRTAVRDGIIETIVNFLKSDDGGAYDVQEVASGEVTLPVVDKDGNEFFANVIVKIPRGTRSNGGYIPYDGYAAAEVYQAEKEAKAQEKAIKEKEKARKAAEKERKKKAKETIKELNEKGLDKMIHEEDDPNQYLDREITV